MNKNNEQKKNTNPETNQKQDNLKPWLKLLPAAAVFAAVCVTCYQTEKSPVDTAVVSNNSIMSTDDIKELIATGNTHDEVLQESSAKSSKASAKTSKKAKKASKIKTGTKKNASTGAAANGSAAGGGGAGSTVTPTTQVHKIASINILDASSETASYFANAQGVVNRIISSQSPNVDAVSGATYSSNGIITAVQNALSQAIPSGNQTTATPTPTPSPKPTKKPVPTPNPDKESPYKDGTYTGTAQGYSGTVTLTAKIKKGIIKSLDVKHTDTPQFFQKAWEVLENSIIQNQSADGIDTVSGATYSSKGILNAMKDIQKQAAKTNAKVTPTPVPTETPNVTPTPEATPTPAAEQTASGVKVEVKSDTYYASSELNLRSDASADADLISSVAAGTQLNSTGVCENGWIRVDYNGQTCYASGDFVTTTAPAADAGETAADTSADTSYDESAE